MDEQDHAEKLGYLSAKLEEVHSDLLSHASEEMGQWDKINNRLVAVEDTHGKIKTTWTFIKAIGGFVVLLFAFEWNALKEMVKRLWGA